VQNQAEDKPRTKRKTTPSSKPSVEIELKKQGPEGIQPRRSARKISAKRLISKPNLTQPAIRAGYTPAFTQIIKAPP
jgi:hypothetical protein